MEWQQFRYNQIHLAKIDPACKWIENVRIKNYPIH